MPNERRELAGVQRLNFFQIYENKGRKLRKIWRIFDAFYGHFGGEGDNRQDEVALRFKARDVRFNLCVKKKIG